MPKTLPNNRYGHCYSCRRQGDSHAVRPQPKVLHKLAGSPLLGHVINAATNHLATREQIIVTGHGAELVEQDLC